MTLRARARFGMALPQVFTEGPVDVGALRAVAVRAEEAGLDSLWSQSQLVGRAAVLEPLTALSYTAAVTNTIGLGAAVIVLTEHFPPQVAKQVASLDHLCNGRLTVSIGVGAPGVTASIGGHDMSRRVRRLLEGLEVMEALWTQPEAVYAGEIWQLDRVPMEPKPLQRPYPPVWLSGIHPNALRRAAKRGSGWMGPGAISTEQFAALAAQVRSNLAEFGRDREQFTMAKRVYVAVDDGDGRAAQRATDRFAAYSSSGLDASRVSAIGSPSEVRSQIEAVIDAGAELVVLNPLFDPVGQLESLLRLIDS